jgi:hypothetical protein
MEFPPHKGELILEHCPNRSYYQSVGEWLAYQQTEPDWPSADERQRAINTNEMWILQWYPDTPIGFNRVAAATLDACLAFANEIPSPPSEVNEVVFQTPKEGKNPNRSWKRILTPFGNILER